MPLINDLDQHSIYIARIATQLLNTQIYPSYTEAYKAVRLILLDAENIGSVSKLGLVNRAIAKAIQDSTNEAWQASTKELTNLAVYESNYYASLIGGYADVRLRTPPQQQVRDWMNKALMALESGQRSQVGTWAEYVDKNKGSFIDAVQNTVKKGYINGSTVNEMVNDLRPMVDGILKRDAEFLIRTGTAFYSNQGRQQMAEHNKHLIAREVPFVQFDNRTSSICRSIDAHYHDGWLLGESPIGYPPFHGNCRTIILHLVEGQEMPDGLRPAVGGKDTKEAREKFEKRENRTGKKPKYRGRKDLDTFDIDRLKTSTKYDTWLLEQPRWFVDDVLGATRTKLFLDGKLSLSSFSDMTLRQLTIDELRVRDAEVFRRLGL